MEEKKKFWIGFNLVKGIGPSRLRVLLTHFGDVETAWNASMHELQQAGLPKNAVENMLKIRSGVDLDKISDQIEAQGIEVLCWEDEEYPRRLVEIDQSPPLLYLRGMLQEIDEWAVGIVGTRRVSSYGRQVAEEIASVLARNGVTVVSGLARGVDGIAHRAALSAGGRTIAVLGNGVDRVYPPEHRELTKEIVSQGVLISDYPLGTPPERMNFPARNRIISGISSAVVVVEAGNSSGALITADFALEQGRDVFAVPGSIYAPQSKGTNRLIQKGARPLLEPEEILELLDLTHVSAHLRARSVLPVNEIEAQLLSILGNQPIHIDEISVEANMPAGEVSATLAMMELKGMVRQVGGMNYVLLRELHSDYDLDSD